MADQFYVDMPIVVIPDTPPETRPQLPQFDPNDDLSQGWPSSDTYHKDNLRLQISPYQNQQAQPSPYLNSPVSPSPFLSSPISSPSSTLSLSLDLATVFGNVTLGDEPSQEEPFPWNLEQNILQDPSPLSTSGNMSSDGLNLSISMANDQVDNLCLSSATSEEEFNDLLTINLNFGDSPNTADHDPSPSQIDFDSYLSTQHSEGADSFFVTNSSVPPIASAFGADLLSTNSINISGGVLQRRHSHSDTRVPKSHPVCGATGSSLMPLDRHDDSRQLRRHSHSHNNSESRISLVTSGISTSSSSSLLSPDMVSAESNTYPLQRQHSHSSESQRTMETIGPLQRAQSVRGPSLYLRPQDIGPADVYPTPKSDGHFLPV
ncbi:hypothetical protein C0995_011786 [Termitomyces sp. Mi166|nr:hypothetical protein C0995_011786 [Termitomyces sp. Mi166\